MRARIYLGGLPEFVGKEDIVKHLSSYGKIMEVKVLTGYGFVEFESRKDAVDVIETFSRQTFLGANITVEFAHPLRKDVPVEQTSSRSSLSRLQPRYAPEHVKLRYPVIVTNIPRGICWQELKDFGRQAGGHVAYCDLDKNRKGQGFIEYLSEEDATHAVRVLNGNKLGGSVVEVFERKRCRKIYRSSRSRSPPRGHRYAYTPSRKLTFIPDHHIHRRPRNRWPHPLSTPYETLPCDSRPSLTRKFRHQEACGYVYDRDVSQYIQARTTIGQELEDARYDWYAYNSLPPSFA